MRLNPALQLDSRTLNELISVYINPVMGYIVIPSIDFSNNILRGQ